MLCWETAAMLPTIMVTAARIAKITDQSWDKVGKAIMNTRAIAANAAALAPTLMYAVMAVGAPS